MRLRMRLRLRLRIGIAKAQVQDEHIKFHTTTKMNSVLSKYSHWFLQWNKDLSEII